MLRFLVNISIYRLSQILDWNYYIERLGSAIQKIITIPAALQAVSNPVPRIAHPDWLHKKMLEKSDIYKQKRISEMFSVVSKEERQQQLQDEAAAERDSCMDIEDIGGGGSKGAVSRPSVTAAKRKRADDSQKAGEDLSLSWKDVLGNPPSMGTTRVRHSMEAFMGFYDYCFTCFQDSIQIWLKFHKKKWSFQGRQRKDRSKRRRTGGDDSQGGGAGVVRMGSGGIGGFLRRTARSMIDLPWQIIQVNFTFCLLHFAFEFLHSWLRRRRLAFTAFGL